MKNQKSNIISKFQGAFSIGLSERGEVFQVNNFSPSPQHYQINDTEILKKCNTPKYTISKASFNPEKSNFSQIGPGCYNTNDSTISQKGHKFKPTSEVIEHKDFRVGPGQYDPELVKKPVKLQNLNLPGRYDSHTENQNNQFPGPGQYTPVYSETIQERMKKILKKDQSFKQNSDKSYIKKPLKQPSSFFKENISQVSQSQLQQLSQNLLQQFSSQQQLIQNNKYGDLEAQYDKIFKNKESFSKNKRFKNNSKSQSIGNLGPGQYIIPSDIELNLKDKNKKITLGQKVIEEKYEKFENKPHPGYYNKIYDYKDSRPQFTIPKSVSHQKKSDLIPGPNYYFQNEQSDINSSSQSKKIFKNLKSQTGLTTSQRYQEKIIDGPSPQHYDIKRKFNTNKGPIMKDQIVENILNPKKLPPGPNKYYINNDSIDISKGFTMGHKTKIQEHENISPGVGRYEQKSQFGKKNNSVKITKGLELNKIINKDEYQPGPGQYNIQSSFGAIPQYLMHKVQKAQDISIY